MDEHFLDLIEEMLVASRLKCFRLLLHQEEHKPIL
jgi:hypothetical protein